MAIATPFRPDITKGRRPRSPVVSPLCATPLDRLGYHCTCRAMTAPSVVRSSICMFGRWTRGCAAPPPMRCGTVSASASSAPACRCGAPLPRCAHCIRNGPATATPGGATLTRSRRRMRRRLAGTGAQLDFTLLHRFAAAGATDYLAEIVRFGEHGDPSRGIGIGYSFATDRPEGFGPDEVTLIEAVLPAASLA